MLDNVLIRSSYDATLLATRLAPGFGAASVGIFPKLVSSGASGGKRQTYTLMSREKSGLSDLFNEGDSNEQVSIKSFRANGSDVSAVMRRGIKSPRSSVHFDAACSGRDRF